MSLATKVQNLDEAVCSSYSTNIQEKGITQSILPPAMGK